MKELLTIIVPCFNEEAMISIFFNKITAVISYLQDQYDVSVELIFVDDGSSDRTPSILEELRACNSFVRYISFTRNFGKEAALLAGLQNSRGDLVALMDVDLQDPPELLIEMIQGVRYEGYDCVATRRVNRKGEPPIRSLFARCFYRLIKKLSGLDIVEGARDYRLMTREMTNAILTLAEKNRFSKGLFSWVGYKTKWISFENINRERGDSKWSFSKLVVYALEGIVAFSTKPLMASSFIGLFLCAISFLLIIFIVLRKIIFGDPVDGWASTICIIVFAAGIQCFCMGILGIYLSKTYLEVKNRPVYIVRHTPEKIHAYAKNESESFD